VDFMQERIVEISSGQEKWWRALSPSSRPFWTGFTAVSIDHSVLRGSVYILSGAQHHLWIDDAFVVWFGLRWAVNMTVSSSQHRTIDVRGDLDARKIVLCQFCFCSIASEGTF
jgi:hypothetical protein